MWRISPQEIISFLKAGAKTVPWITLNPIFRRTGTGLAMKTNIYESDFLTSLWPGWCHPDATQDLFDLIFPFFVSRFCLVHPAAVVGPYVSFSRTVLGWRRLTDHKLVHTIIFLRLLLMHGAWWVCKATVCWSTWDFALGISCCLQGTKTYKKI